MPHLNEVITKLPLKIERKHKKRVKRIRAIEAEGRKDLRSITR